MMGISYGGISQLFTAQTRPPSLAAISPFSVLDATASTLYPGGILNTGFAVPGRRSDSTTREPAGSDSGQPWAYQRIQNGDATCAQNQALHGEAQDLLQTIQANAQYQPVGRRCARPRHFRPQDQRAGFHGLPVAGRADRWALRRCSRNTSPGRARNGSRSPTARMSTRSIRRRSTALVRLPRRCTSRSRHRTRTRVVVKLPRRRSSITQAMGSARH